MRRGLGAGTGGRERYGQGNPHRRVPGIRAAESNNRIERLHGTEKERTKVMRAFDTDDGAAMIAKGFRVHYNLVKPHITLGGETPGGLGGHIPAGWFPMESDSRSRRHPRSYSRPFRGRPDGITRLGDRTGERELDDGGGFHRATGVSGRRASGARGPR